MIQNQYQTLYYPPPIYYIQGPRGPRGYPGMPGMPGPAGTPGLVPVTLVNSSTYTPALTDYLLAVNTANAVNITLPIAPAGTVFVIKDAGGNSQVNNVTVTASIDGATNYKLNINYSSITLVFNGVEWNVI